MVWRRSARLGRRGLSCLFYQVGEHFTEPIHSSLGLPPGIAQHPTGEHGGRFAHVVGTRA